MTVKILVVEDNPLNMELTLALLEQSGHEVLQAGSAEVGIDIARSQLPTLIFMDVTLPGMTGLEAVRLLKADSATKDIPVIIMTSHALSRDEINAQESGSDGYISKPIDFRQFREMLSRFLPENEASG